MTKARSKNYDSELLMTTFKSLQYLIKGLGANTGAAMMNKEEQFIYLLIVLKNEGFITEPYKFH